MVINQKLHSPVCCTRNMALDLPSEDDGGPDFDILPQPVAIRAKAKPKPAPKPSQQPKKPRQPIQKRPATSSSRSKRPASVMEGPLGSGITLPDDDTGEDILGLGVGGAPSLPKQRSLLVDLDQKLMTFDDTTLKLAAAHVPSFVRHPFHDLEPILQKPSRPCDESLIDTLWEVFSVPRLQPIMNELGGRCRRSFDLKSFWDFREPHYQKGLLQDLASLQPLSVMLCPPCTYVCQLMHSNWKKMDPKKRVINLEDACGHIDFSMWIACYQHDHQRFFGFEHPGGSLAWERASVP